MSEDTGADDDKNRHASKGTFPNRTWPDGKAWTGSTRSRKTRIVVRTIFAWDVDRGCDA